MLDVETRLPWDATRAELRCQPFIDRKETDHCRFETILAAPETLSGRHYTRLPRFFWKDEGQ